MRQYILAQWKDHKATITLVIIGFFVANMILSVGVTLSRRQFEYYQDGMIGDPEDQVIIDFTEKDREKVWDYFRRLKQMGEIQILNIDVVPVKLKEKELSIHPVPVWFENQEAWHIPIIEGDYLKVKDMETDKHSVILGKMAAKELGAKTGDIVQIGRKDYRVAGIAGRTYRETQWDDVIYLPCESFFRDNSDLLRDDNTILLKSGKEKFIQQYKKNWQADMQYSEVAGDIDTSGLHNAVVLTIISSVSVFIIAIVNISNLMLYWILERKKTYGIIKALGGHNGYIFRMIFAEVLVLTLVSGILALAVQGILHMIFASLPLEMTMLNIWTALLTAFVTGGIAALIPAVRAMKLQPVKILNEGDQ